MKRIKCLFSLCLTYQNCVIMFFIYIVSYLSSAKVFLMLVAFNCNLPNCLCVSCNSIDVIFWIFFYSLIAFMWQIFMLYNYSLQFTCIGMTHAFLEEVKLIDFSISSIHFCQCLLIHFIYFIPIYCNAFNYFATVAWNMGGPI